MFKLDFRKQSEFIQTAKRENASRKGIVPTDEMSEESQLKKNRLQTRVLLTERAVDGERDEERAMRDEPFVCQEPLDSGIARVTRGHRIAAILLWRRHRGTRSETKTPKAKIEWKTQNVRHKE